MQHLKNSLWCALGCVALAFGVIGVALPVLPTTPFVILAAFAFGKSSKRLQRLLERNRVFGPIIADWRMHGAIATEYKALAILMMGAVLALSVALSIETLVLVIQIVCMGAAAIFIFTRPSRVAST